MSDFRDRTKEAMDGAADIARDQLHTFKKLDKNVQIVIVAVAGAVAVIFIAWIFWPRTLDVTVERIVADNIMGNSVVILNNESFDLGKTTVIVNDAYENTIQNLPPGEALAIVVTNFHPQGNPEGKPPGEDLVPRKVIVRSKKGRLTFQFSR